MSTRSTRETGAKILAAMPAFSRGYRKESDQAERIEIDTWRAAQQLIAKICGVSVPADPADVYRDDGGMDMPSRNGHARALDRTVPRR